ncbi:E3 ubiquitin-protein ligase TTC3 [Pseudochaenichthys georgianus]|uniref:E3 ubiquitin-protein ligase TTC3 n=1 Tax=Pseudochaenichthys georgianus TaxID=52239 RepID=UPI00146A6F8B|nr:E3 ubiquitin-protein ligase TTC3 [Pseudochaenichthys georgianus]
MSDSDSEIGEEWEAIHNRTPVKLLTRNDTVVALRPQEIVFDKWSQIPLETRRQAGERMRICAFWLPLLLQRDEPSNPSCWAYQIDLISSDTDDLDMKHLQKIETLEAILRALEKGTVKRDQTKHVIWISNMFNLRTPEALKDAMCWLERTGEPGIRHRVMSLGHPQICFTALHVIFTEFAKYIQKMGSDSEKTMKELNVRPAEYLIEKSEEMKKKGNENFKNMQFEEAVKYYSKAIKLYPDNHFIYGNRALCYIRCKKYLKAVTDGKRATLIKPLWVKGHFRFCEALFFLGEGKKAIEANVLARGLCKDNRDGIKDLEDQHEKFLLEMPEPKVVPSKKNQSKKAQTLEPRPLSVNSVHKNDPPPKSKTPVVKPEKQQVKNEKTVPSEGSTKNSKPSKSEPPTKNGKGDSGTPTKKKPKNRSPPEVKKQNEGDSKTGACKELKVMVQDAHSALTDLRCRNAEQAFRKALNILDTSTAKEVGLSTLDVLLLLYGHAAALTEIGQPEELGEAQKLLVKIKSFEERTFQCLVYYATGRVFLKENRFAVALEQFSDSLQTVKNKITPGKLTWPLTNEIVKETQPDYFKAMLEQAIELCTFPPPPDAICRLEICLCPMKAEIYLTDPDFKGYIRISCCQSCIIEYHIACWKALKTSSFSDRNEKDFLQELCFTSDCLGKICSIVIFGTTGLPKCTFKAAITKPSTPKKLKVNQKCTSLRKMKAKDEHKLKRRQHKQSFIEKQTINEEILLQKEDSTTQIEQKAWLLYRDRVLLQISQNLELLREEPGLQASALTQSLKPWLELDSSRGNQIAERILNWKPMETLGLVVELLLERKNRVWARILIQLLSSCRDINPKLHNWASHLNDAGLNAAKSFIDRHAGHLETLDLAFLLGFGPMQDSIIEEFDIGPDLFSTIGLTETEYLKQAPHDNMRLFIWTLEEHRDQFLSCHAILDEYFDMMDGHCSVLKKSDENQNNSPLKSRARKKKKGANGVIVWSGNSSQTQREEWDQDFFEDDTLSFLHPSDPFSVPSHLREQVATFEDQYNTTRHRGHYKNILDNNPDPTKESLYDYFAQILEEHGPLVAEDPLLVGELDNFPVVAKDKIQEVGGFEVFLLESLRFIKMGRCIGLAKHAVTLQQAGHGASLDDLDDITDPDIEYPCPGLDEGSFSAFPSDKNGYSHAQNVYPILPNPYAFAPLPHAPAFVGVNNSFYAWSNGDDEKQDPYFIPDDDGALDLFRSAGDRGVSETSSVSSDESVLKKHAAVQTCNETVRSVAVNTEIHEPFESCPGDINKKQHSGRMLEQSMKEMSKDCDKVNLTHKEDLAVLEEEVQQITTNIQVTIQELGMFQQKLEEEVKKDQKEKRANQEGLKALKVETEDLVTQHRSFTQIIREKKNSFDNKLNDFLELSNQSAAEKMSLEDEIKRCQVSLTSATRRSHSAQVLVVESSRDQGMCVLYRDLTNAKALLSKLDEAAHRYPTPDVELTRNSCRVNIQDVEKKISSAEAQYQEQLDQVKNGRRVSELIPIAVSNQPNPPAAPVSVAARQSAATPPPSASHSLPSYSQPSAAAPHKPPPRTMESAHSTVFEKAMERLVSMFPDYKRPELMRFVQDLRFSSGSSLNNMALQDMVGGVTQLILDHQEKLNAAKLNAKGCGSPAQCAAPVWQPMGHPRVKHSDALNVEDPCIICHEDMSPDDICVLECRHSFHDKCIRSWLKEQSTCPTCRDHALMPDDFPELSGRRRQAP